MPAVTWSITNGSLPTGLYLDYIGLIFGTPKTAGTFNFTVTAKATKGTESDSRNLSIVIGSSTLSVPSSITTSLNENTMSQNSVGCSVGYGSFAIVLLGVVTFVQRRKDRS
jgi:hypothetical protein